MTDIAEIKKMKKQAELQIITILQALSDKSALDVIGVDVDTHMARPMMTKAPQEVVTDVRIKVEIP